MIGIISPCSTSRTAQQAPGPRPFPEASSAKRSNCCDRTNPPAIACAEGRHMLCGSTLRRAEGSSKSWHPAPHSATLGAPTPTSILAAFPTTYPRSLSSSRVPRHGLCARVFGLAFLGPPNEILEGAHPWLVSMGSYDPTPIFLFYPWVYLSLLCHSACPPHEGEQRGIRVVFPRRRAPLDPISAC